jgi:hypothetical protein
MRLGALFTVCLLGLGGCGPAWSPLSAPSKPCQTISEIEFNTAVEAGAARGDAKIAKDGTVSLTNGPGVVHCATYTSALKPCRRPNDYVIRYDTEEGAPQFVLVPANEEYRFNVKARPHTCEILER